MPEYSGRNFLSPVYISIGWNDRNSGLCVLWGDGDRFDLNSRRYFHNILAVDFVHAAARDLWGVRFLDFSPHRSHAIRDDLF